MQHGIRLALVAIFLLISVSFCQDNISLRLNVVPYKDKTFLSINFTKIWKNGLFEENDLKCIHSTEKSMELPNSVTFKIIGNPQIIVGSPFSQEYELDMKTDGYVQCNYKSTTSSVEFFRFENRHVTVVRFNTSQDVDQVQKTIGSKEFTVRNIANDLQILHFFTNLTKPQEMPEDDSAAIEKLKIILNETNLFKINETIKGRNKYVRSTRFCPPLEEYQIPYSYYGRKFSYQGGTLRCDGDFFIGAYWNPEDIDTLKFKNIRRPRKNPNIEIKTPLIIFETKKPNIASGEDIEIFSEILKNASVIYEKELPVIANKFEQIITGKGREILRNINGNRKVTNGLLMNLNLALLKTETWKFDQEVKPNFTVRVENLKITGSAGMLAIDDKTGDLNNITSFTKEMSIDQVVKSSLR